jgi:hypothetical protein
LSTYCRPGTTAGPAKPQTAQLSGAHEGEMDFGTVSCFEAMWTGEVDYNCAEQDDDLWLEGREKL